MTIAVIIARGGSKRLPRKNAKLFCGHPLVSWAITQAVCSELIDEVWLSTDDDELENIGLNYGANVIRRPDWPDADLVAANRPFIHAIKYLKELYGDEFNTVVTILPTTPLIKPGELDEAIRKYKEYGCDKLRNLISQRESVIFKKIHPYRAKLKIFDKRYNYLYQATSWGVTSPEGYLSWTQSIPDDDKTLDQIACSEDPYESECYFIPAEVWQGLDVDTQEEFELAELLMEYYILKGKGMNVYHEYKEEWENRKREISNKEKELEEEQIINNALNKYGVKLE